MACVKTVIIALIIATIAVMLGPLFNIDIQKTVVNVLQDFHFPIFNSDKSTSSNTEYDLYNVISSKSDSRYTKKLLAKFNGEPESFGLYLAILGRVYDVSKGKQYYGPGGGYAFFAGKDGTKAYMTGEFNENGLIDETVGLTNAQMLELENWIKFYDKTYTYIGIVIGNFYNEKGEPTQALYSTIDAIKAAYAEKKEHDAEKQRFPPCNSQSKKGEYRRVFCTEKSGGIVRTWMGYPRQFFTTGSNNPRCACVNDNDLNNPHMKEYEGCDSKARSCSLPPL